ncbi:hypothetical protein ACIRVF_33650 [Kitasatospora sp. NPDC101157]|uniref:hypothetical protein n=1 Tax=Kitasatospora sp. NPDC101157 TaxID=3364098 RepID=UPI00382169B3
MLEPVETLTAVSEALKSTVHDNIGDVERLTGFADPRKSKTDPVLVGMVLLPFAAIQDSSRSFEWQANHSPPPWGGHRNYHRIRSSV